MRTRCIITACTLTLEGSAHGVAGGLHLQGSTFIFNGNYDSETGETQWVPLEELGYSKVITLPCGIDGDHFERRGVFVIPARLSLLNETAQNCIAGERVPA